MADQDQSAGLLDSSSFAGIIRRMYPSLASATDNDNILTHAILRVHPEFRDHVLDPGGPAEAPRKPTLPEYGRGMAPPSPLEPLGPEGDTAPSLRRASAKGGPGLVQTTAGDLRAGARRQDEGVPAQVLATIPEGVSRAASGVSELSRAMPGARYPSTMQPPTLQSAAQAGADVIGGGMQAGSLLIPEALATQPLKVIAGIGAGSAAAMTTEKAGTALGAPPAYVHLASEIAGLVGGITGGEGAGAARDAAVAGNEAFRTELGASRMPPGGVDAAGNAVAEGMMLDAAKRHAEGVSDQQSAANLTGWLEDRHQNAEIDKLSLGLAENYRLNQIAARMKTEQYAHGSAFDTVEAMTAAGAPPEPLALPAAPEPFGYLEAGSPARFLADARDQEYPGPSFRPPDPNAIDVVDPERAAIGRQEIATSSQAPPEMIQTLGEQLASGLENQPPQAVRPTETTRGKMNERLDFKDRARDQIAQAVSEMDGMTYQKPKLVTDIDRPDANGKTDYFTPPVAGSEWYWRVVGRGTENPPSRAVIAELMRAYKDSDGSVSGKDLTPATIAKVREITDHKTDSGVRRLYEDWAPQIKKAVEKRTTAIMGYERYARETAAAEREAAGGTETLQPEQGTQENQPPATSQLAASGELPVGDGKVGPASSVESALPAGGEDDLPEFLRDLQSETEDAAPDGRKPFRERIAGEEGHLILNLAPGNKAGLTKWLAERSDEYGDQDWYQHAISLMEAGDHRGAWRVAAIASSKAMAGGAVKDREERGGVVIGEDRARAAVEKQLGYKLPEDTKVSPETGVITFPENGGVNLKARFSDLTLGKTFVSDVLNAVDPTQITRVEDSEGHLDEAFVRDHPEMRITSQMADQIVRDMPPSVKEAFEQTGLTEVQIGAHFRRAFREAGQVLNLAKQWQDANWDSILHLDPLTGTTRGPGAAGRLEFLPAERAKAISDYLEDKRKLSQEDYERILSDIQKLSPKEMKQLGFDLPPGMAEDSAKAVTYTRNWLRRQQKLLQLGKQVEAISAANPDIDKAMLSAAMGATDESVPGKIREKYLSLMRARLSFLISQTSTGFHVLASQGARYAFGMPEELIRSAAAAASGDTEGASQYLGFAKNLAKNVLRPGKIPMGLVKRPWTDGIQDLFEWGGTAFGDMPAEDTRKTLMAMEQESPASLSHMMATLELSKENPDVPGSSRTIPAPITNFLTAFMRFHAGMYRAMVSDAMIRTAIEAKGDDPSAILASEGGLTAKYGADEAGRIFNSAVAAALNYTQAGDAYAGVIPIGGKDKTGGTFPAQIIDLFSMKSVPEVGAFLKMGIPFPRFVFGAVPRYLWDRMPGTIIADIARAKFPIFGKGRLGLGLELKEIEQTTIPHLAAEHGRAEADAAGALSALIQANEDTGAAAKAFKAVEARASKAGGLPGMEEDLQNVHEDLLERLQEKQKAVDAYKAADWKANDVRQMLDKQTEKLHKLQEIDPPDYKAALARQAMGAVFLTAAIGIRAGQDDDTKWSDLRVGGHDLDTKFMSGLSQFLLPADVLVNFSRHTDWKAVEDELHKAGYTKDGIVGQAAGNPAGAINALRKAMASGYTGKYTKPELAKEAAEAFLSLAPLIGGMSSIVDMTTGKGAAGESVLDHPLDFLATYIGQAMGGFTLPAKQFSDLIGSIYQPESLSYTPETPGEHNSLLKELYQPSAANVPGLRETITPKISAITGQPKENDRSGLKPLGVAAKVVSKIEREMEAVGLPYAEAVPRVSGDREFDNAVSKAYSKILNEYSDQLLAIPEYKGANPAIRRDLFKSALGSLKQTALYQAGEALGLTGEATYDRIESPAKKDKIKLYQRYMAELQAETAKDHPEEPPAEDKPIASAAGAAPAGRHAPPSGFLDHAAGSSPSSLQRGAPPVGMGVG